MPLYRWNADNLEAVTPTTFEAEWLQEANLQRLLRDQPDVLEEGLFIVAEEFGNWQDSYRSIDLLGLDRTGRLVIIELKRTQSGDHSELQAIRYAAMVSIMTLEDVIEAHSGYLARRGINEDARIQVLNQLGVADEADAEIRTKDPRIILASAGFSKELTTSVLWLNDRQWTGHYLHPFAPLSQRRRDNDGHRPGNAIAGVFRLLGKGSGKRSCRTQAAQTR